tara:strand:+ start:2068 stop:2316 length:249 start_codon:yes stop_codon:yes gene_type:complete
MKYTKQFIRTYEILNNPYINRHIMGTYLSKEELENFQPKYNKYSGQPETKVVGFTIKEKESLERIDINIKEIKKGLEKILKD